MCRVSAVCWCLARALSPAQVRPAFSDMQSRDAAQSGAMASAGVPDQASNIRTAQHKAVQPSTRTAGTYP